MEHGWMLVDHQHTLSTIPTPWVITEPKGRDHPQGVVMYSQVSPGHPRTSSIGLSGGHVLHIPVYFGTTDPVGSIIDPPGTVVPRFQTKWGNIGFVRLERVCTCTLIPSHRPFTIFGTHRVTHTHAWSHYGARCV